MKNFENSRTIHPYTVKSIETLLSLFTEEQKEILAIQVNETKITLAEQFCGRWWNYVPIADNPLIFKTAAAKIIATNKSWIDFIKKLQEDDLFSKLLDPENYKDTHKKITSSKTTDKRKVDTDASSGNLVRTIARTVGGEGGNNRAYDYVEEWDTVDKARLDNMTLEKNSKPTFSTETGQEDDTRGENEQEKTTWIDKKENLDSYTSTRDKTLGITAKFLASTKGESASSILLHDIYASQSSNATTGESGTQGTTFVDGLRRQGHTTTRERIILADAINNIKDIDFMDIREKIYKKLDALFIYRKKTCL